MTVDKALASRILNYISEHYMEPLDLETVAREFGYSRNYFSMLFNKIVGMGFNAYLNIYRMDKVNEMKSVNKDKLKINDILAKCGFASSETYYRTVRKMKRDYYGKID